MNPANLEAGANHIHHEYGAAPRPYRAAKGIERFFVRLKRDGRTLAVLSGDTDQEARELAQRLAETLFQQQGGWSIEPA